MDKLMTEGSRYVSTLPGVSAGSAVHCRPCRSLKYGDLWIGRDVATAIKNQLSEGAFTEEGGLLTCSGKYGSDVFSCGRFNPQGQLCLSLNRPHVFRQSTTEVLDRCSGYGHQAMICTIPTVLTDHCTCPCSVGVESGVTGFSYRQLSVSDGRMILIKKLIVQILRRNGHCVKESQLEEWVESRVRDSKPEQADFVEQFFHSLSGCETAVLTPPTAERDDDRFLESSPYVHFSRPRLPHSLLCDGKRFIREKRIVSRHGYDKNINLIEVKAKDGTMSRVASLASRLCQLHHTLAGEEKSSVRLVHVTSHSRSFMLQEAMVLADVHAESHKQSSTLKQHLILCSDVEVFEGGVAIRDYSLVNLLQMRHSQMTAAYGVKYGAKAHDAEIQSVVNKTTEAVVKFELLSTDPQSKIKLMVPSQPNSGTDVRFSGSFVLYNYARLANLLANFEKACKQGTYPPLPDISLIDFSLLNDEEEWHILFHYILQYPVMVREVSSSICDCETIIRLETKLKKVCQFLTQLSHSVSTYYSRVKVLLAPEPHLFPLIHARLVLVMTIKQTMFNALQLLAIDPPQQL